MLRTMKNFSVIIEEVCNGNTIYGCNVITPKEKKSAEKPVHSNIISRGTIQFLDRIGKLTVAADVIFVNNNPFVVRVWGGVNLTIMEYVSQRLKTVLANSIGKIFQFY